MSSWKVRAKGTAARQPLGNGSNEASPQGLLAVGGGLKQYRKTDTVWRACLPGSLGGTMESITRGLAGRAV
jgi:hypothetical protein